MPQPTFDAELVSSQFLTDNTLELTFRTHELTHFEAGQFVSFFLPCGDQTIRRSYSIASSPDELVAEGLFQIAIALVPDGRASGSFSAAKVGCRLPFSGPFGQLVLPASDAGELPAAGRLVLVGTGTGMAPYRSMLPQLKQLKQQGQRMELLMGVRRRDDLFYMDDFRSLVDRGEAVGVGCCLSREDAVDPAAGEYKGYVQRRLQELSLQPELDCVYLCGNPDMVEDCFKRLMEEGFEKSAVKKEKYVLSR